MFYNTTSLSVGTHLNNQTQKKTYGSVTLKDKPVVFVNGIIARNIKGFIWLWTHFLKIRWRLRKAAGCRQVKAGICGVKEVMMVTYWDSEEMLHAFVQDSAHKSWMKYFFSNPTHLTFYNEAYFATHSGRYAGPPQGLALFH